MVEVQNVFIELTFEVQLSTINIMQVKKQGGKTTGQNQYERVALEGSGESVRSEE